MASKRNKCRQMKRTAAKVNQLVRGLRWGRSFAAVEEAMNALATVRERPDLLGRNATRLVDAIINETFDLRAMLESRWLKEIK